MKTSVVIPARLGSTRLPKKVLAKLNGKSIVWHVWNQVSKMKLADEIFVATDAEEVVQEVTSWGGKSLMTSPDCQTGTERVASVLDKLSGDLILCVQGDEPFVDPFMLDAMVEEVAISKPDIITPVFPIKEADELFNPNVVKVVRAPSGKAIYFSRSPIPYVRGHDEEHWLSHHVFWGHIGVYGYQRFVLNNYHNLPESQLAKTESLEQLQFLENDYKIQTIETSKRTIAIDVAADLEAAEKYIKNHEHTLTESIR